MFMYLIFYMAKNNYNDNVLKTNSVRKGHAEDFNICLKQNNMKDLYKIH
jgi:hypothetical protein